MKSKKKCRNWPNFYVSSEINYAQYFTSNCPLIQSLISIYDKISIAFFVSLNKADPGYILCIFIDFCKAFDTTDFRILLRNLDHYGFRGQVNWFKNYLYDRLQFVNIGETFLTKKEATYGVPQGGILSPVFLDKWFTKS